ncbi:MAG: flavodoxin family protein [Desulfohalobiaceae bacterium]
MRILGISGSPRREDISGTRTLVGAVLEHTGLEHDLVSLRGRSISGCTGCLRCAADNVCKTEDDMPPLREAVAQANAYVVGAPNHFSGCNALTRAFLERWFQFRHREGDLLWGKPGVAIGVGGMDGGPPARDIERFFLFNLIEPVATVTATGAAPCYFCGFGETCGIGVPRMRHGEDVEIGPEITPKVEEQPEAMHAAAGAGEHLGRILQDGWHRRRAALRAQERLMDWMAEK